MKTKLAISLGVCLCAAANLSAQIATNWLPGRVLVKLVPDYLRPRVYALNQSSGTNNGTLLALNSTNGATLAEIAVGINPTDMTITPAGDTLYVINTGSRTVTKVDLNSFAVASEKPISTPNTYSLSNPLYLVAKQSGLLFYTDGAWGPEIYAFDYDAGTNWLVLDTGGNQSFGAGGMVMNRGGNTLYIWRQYGWSAGYANSSIASLAVGSDSSLTMTATGPSQSRDPLDTRIFLDAAETRIFNKVQMVSATNVSVLLSQFTENIYAISFDGSLAFGPTKVFNAQNGVMLTNFSISTTVQCLSGDQQQLFRYRASTSDLFVHDMAAVAPVTGPAIIPTPEDGAVVGLAPSSLVWSVSPIALAYDVYFGTNQAQVTAATPASPQYAGRITSTSRAVPQALSAGSTYYWRVDVVGFSSTNAGPTWSFTVASLTVTPAQIAIGAITTFNPAATSLSLTSAVPKAWTASVVGANWLGIGATSGTSPSTLGVSFNTAALPAGLYTNQINIVADGLTIGVPVTVDIKPLNIVKMATDYQRPYIYALQAPALSGQNGQLLFINTTTTNIDRALPIGINPVDLTVHYGEGRLYIASWTENATYVVDLNTQTLLPPLHLGTDVYKINAGRPGQLVTEEEDQWISARLINTTNGATIASAGLREGDGEFDPTGRYYYHVDNNISSASYSGLQKYDVSSNSFASVASVGGHYYYGSRNLIISPDGSRLFWTGAAYTADLAEIGNLGEEIYATTAHGDLALGSAHVFNVSNGQSIYTWPFSTSVMAVSGDQTKVLLFNTTTKQLVTIPMSAIANVPGPGLNPNPPDGSVVNLPLVNVSWTASPFALSYRVFFGTSPAAVAAADTNSVLYLGSTTSTAFALPSLSAGTTYYWRVDSVGFSSVVTGPVWSFATSSITVSPQQWSLKGVVGLPILPQTVSVTAGAPTAWTLSVAQPWLVPSAASGTTPASVTLNFNTANLAVGFFTNQLTFVAAGVTLQVPVVVQLFNLNATKMVADPTRNMIYALHPGSGGVDDAFVLFLNTDTGVVEKVLPIGSNASDLTVHPREDRLYVSNWQRAQTRVVDLKTRTELPSLALGTDVYKINAGLTGRIVIEGEDQWIYMSLINTTNGATVATGFVREGDGECDPSGRYYYHVDNNSSGAGITKYDIGNNSFVSVAGAGKHNGYGSRNLVMSLNGSRLFWTAAMYDANLYDYGVIGPEIYSCSTNGSLAFGASQAYDTTTKQLVYSLPVSSTVQVVDRMDQRLWYFNSSTARIESIPLLTIRSPSITRQPPANTSVAVGGNVYLTVTAVGLAPLTYQWTLAGTNLPAATNYFLSMSGILAPQEGDYRVVVSNPYNGVTSAIAHVTVLVAPTITGQPQGSNVLAGQAISLAVEAAGSGPLSYSWQFENTTISGATTSRLTIPNAQAINEGVYRAIVANSIGSATSAVALVRVIPSGPAIVSAPDSLSVGASSNASFSVVATGTQPLSYQWLFDGTPLAGMTGTQVSLGNVQAANAGSYQVAVANSLGVTTSAVATLTVVAVVPYFVIQPTGASLPAGTNLTLSALARGSEPIGYQWQRNGTNLAGATQTALLFSNLGLGDNGSYWVLASNAAGVSTSLVAGVVVTAAPPVFVEQPASVSVLAGSSVTLNSRATGCAPLGYQWYFQTNPLADQTNRQLTLSPVPLSSAGPYYVVASNVFDTATSVVAMLTVTTAPPVFALQPSSVTVVAGSMASLTARVSGATPISYQWYFQGNPLASQINSQLTFSPVTIDVAGPYFLVASNLFGVATSAVAQVTVNLGPSFLQGLSNIVVDAGQTVTLTAVASGTSPLAYSWQFNGAAIPGTNSVLTLTNLQPAQSGYYRVTASSQYGSVSSTARVSVLGPPARVIAWGDDSGNQTDVPVGLDDVVAVAGGDYHTLALRHNGSLAAWGFDGDGQTDVPSSPLCFVSVAAGADHSLAITKTGSMVAWGRNDYGQCNVPASATSVLAVAAGDSHSLALLSSGTVVGWGDNSFGQVSGSSQLTGIRAIAAGRNHSLALRNNGTVVGWGFNAYGQASPPAGITNAAGIAAGYLHSAALLSNGTVVVWGDNTYGQTDTPPGLSNVVALAAGDFHTCALLADGSVVAWGDDWYGQTNVPLAVASGYYHGLSLVPAPLPPHLENCRYVAGQFVLDLHGEAGRKVLLQASTNLKHWVTLQAYVLTDAPVSFTDAESALYPRRFYRLIPAEGLARMEQYHWSGGQFGWSLVGEPGRPVVIQASTNLQTWTPIGDAVLGTAPIPFSDPQSGLLPARFYRLVAP